MAHNTETPKNHVDVLVATTAGTWPKNGYETLPDHQKLEIALKKAADALDITNTAGWIVTAGGRTVDATKSYVENELSGRVALDYGPPASGGGCRA